MTARDRRGVAWLWCETHHVSVLENEINQNHLGQRWCDDAETDDDQLHCRFSTLHAGEPDQ